MVDRIALAPGQHGRFAVVKLWPGIQTAEDECIARLDIAARALGLECVQVHADGTALADPAWKASQANVDFVLHLHYDTPKQYDAFSLVALWNPLAFYHQWGYERTSRNLATHDDFASCLSPAADDHAARLVRRSGNHLPPLFTMFHSTAGIVHPPSLGEGRLFYAGINWEAISGTGSRHQEVLRRLDGTGLLRIHGPEVFQGVRVWAGYRSYAGEVPFDGRSMVDAIARAGIALVLSSQAHRDSELMSNRLFESIAAGALVICDENPFAARHFGDALLYIDSRWPVDHLVEAITAHVDWARRHPDAALAKIARAQALFAERFTLERSLRDLYAGLPARRQALQARRHPPQAPRPRARLFLLMPQDQPGVLEQHLASAACQDWDDLRACLVVDEGLDPVATARIARAASAASVAVRRVAFHQPALHPAPARRRPLGQVLADLLADAPTEHDGDEVFIAVAPNERLLSNHVSVLAGALQRDPAAGSAAVAALHDDGSAARCVHELIDFNWLNTAAPAGLARFGFRRSHLPADLGCALRHVDARASAVLVGDGRLLQELPATVVIDLARPYPPPGGADPALETQVIRDFCPRALDIRTGHGREPVTPQARVEAPVAEPAWSLFTLARRLATPGWVRLQLRVLRQQGAKARWAVLRRKLGLA